MGAVGSGDNDVKMLKKSKVAFSKLLMMDHDAAKAADIILTTDDLEEVVFAVSQGREYKDHLMKFIMLQLPSSFSAVALVLAQVFYYNTILVSGLFVFLINLVYLPIGLTCIVREKAADNRHLDMISRWRADQALVGTKTITKYMQGE